MKIGPNAVAVTGIGVASPLGHDTTSLLRGLFESRNCLGPLSLFDAGIETVRKTLYSYRNLPYCSNSVAIVVSCDIGRGIPCASPAIIWPMPRRVMLDLTSRPSS